jgi:uncharacterized OB-fold protein
VTLPEITPLNEHFWRGGASGRLLFLKCDRCSWFVHPPVPICPKCTSRELKPTPVSGRATVAACTINHQRWGPEEEAPYAIAIVELPEQPGLRLTTNVVGCPPEQVRVGMQVRVRFEAQGDVWLPLFEPA